MLDDGFYISAYCQIDPIMNSFGTSLRHDFNISLWEKRNENITLLHHWEIERHTGNKQHEISFYSKEEFFQYLDLLLSDYGLSTKDITQIIGMPEISGDDIDYHYNYGDSFTYHSMCHLYSSMLMNSDIFYNDKILSLSLDRGSDPLVDRELEKLYNFTGAYSDKGKVDLFKISSPGMLWNIAFKKFNIREGTLMALANASESISYESFYNKDDLINLYNDSDAMNAVDFFNTITGRIFSYKGKDAGIHFNYFDKNFSEDENKLSILMKVVQKISLDMVDKNMEYAINKYGINLENTYISLSGGYALNCPTNTYIMHKYKLKGQLIPPCTNDCGQAIGMGLLHFASNMDKINFTLKSSYYGDIDDDLSVLESNEYKGFIESVNDSVEKFTDDVIEAPIVWFDGRAEIGPRALGHRSILADPRTTASKDLLNEYKQREWWRPVAPIILEEEVDNWFEGGFHSPFMLNNFIVKQGKKNEILAILHLDDTARVQTINEEDNSKLYHLIRQFALKTNIPIICNTSLNDKGEPIINQLSQALNFALRKGIQVVYFNGIRIKLINHNRYIKEGAEKRASDFFNKKSDEIMKTHNPYGLKLNEYVNYLSFDMLKNLSVADSKDAAIIKKFSKRLENDLFINLGNEIKKI